MEYKADTNFGIGFLLSETLPYLLINLITFARNMAFIEPLIVHLRLAVLNEVRPVGAYAAFLGRLIFMEIIGFFKCASALTLAK